MPKVECVLDVIAAGGTYDPADEVSFWEIMARYVSQRDPDTKEEYITVTAEQMLQYAMAVYPDVTALPAIPADNTDVTHVAAGADTPEQYKIKVTEAAELDMTVDSYSEGILTVTVGSGEEAVTYVVVYEEAEIISITKQ